MEALEPHLTPGGPKERARLSRWLRTLASTFALVLVTSGCAYISYSSASSTGTLGSFDSDGPAVSADGQIVAFESSSSNLVPNDTNGRKDIFVHDHATGVTERVSVTSAGGQVCCGQNQYPGISADGRYVAFWSQAGIALGDTNNVWDVYIHDRVTDVTERVSVDSNEVGSSGSPGVGFMRSPSVSADGRYVAFEFPAGDLVPGDTNGYEDIFVRDRVAGTTERVSLSNSGSQVLFTSFAPSMSDDGRYVAFQSGSTQLVSGDTNLAVDVFVRDRVAATTTRVSVGPSGVQANGASTRAEISGDGRFVAFQSAATNLTSAADTNGVSDVFVHDRDTGVTQIVSKDSSGGQANGASIRPSISDDGSVVAFVSDASDLVADDTNGVRDVFVRALDRTTRASVDQSGNQVSDPSDVSLDTGVSEKNGRYLSGDGRYIAFVSESLDLIPPGSLFDHQVFLRRALEPGVLSGSVSIAPGNSALMVINGRWFESASTTASVVGPEGVTIPSLSVPGPNDTLYLTVSVASDAVPGPRDVLVWNPGNWDVRSGASAICYGCITVT